MTDVLMHAKVGLVEVGNGIAVGALEGIPVGGDVGPVVVGFDDVDLLEVGNCVGTLDGLADGVDVGALEGLPIGGDVGPVVVGPEEVAQLEVGNCVRALDGLADGIDVGAIEGLLVWGDVGPVVVGFDVVDLRVGAAEFAVQRDTLYMLVLHRLEQHLESRAVQGTPVQLHWRSPNE